MHGLGEGVVGEGLLHLDGLTGVDELVHVGGHGESFADTAPASPAALALGVGECQC